MVEAKAKTKMRHKTAISEFKKWKKSHPKATRQDQIEMFDFFVDTSTRKTAIKNAA